MNLFDYAVEFHSLLDRKGPGSREETLRAINCIPDFKGLSEILVVGCATGEEVFTIAENTDASIVAIDIIPAFLDVLKANIEKSSLSGRIKTRLQSMDSLDYMASHFDVIWSENSISHIGFERGLKEWHEYIKKDGFLVVSDICWLTNERGDDLQSFCERISADVDTIENKKRIFAQHGYEVVADFVLPEECWLEKYYIPMREKVPAFLRKYPQSELVICLMDEVKLEIDMYSKYKENYGNVFFVTRVVK